jgi:RimJ/RimL family protein N-acetyltransferase
MSTPILRDFPARLDTERLTLRAPAAGDGPANYAAIADSLDELRPWMPWACELLSVETQEAVMRRAHADFVARTDLMLLIFLKGTGTMIGSTGLHRIDWRVPRFEIGYWLRTGYTGRGYMTETVHAVAGFAFDTLGARRVEIRCDQANTRSAAVAQRCGFELEGILHNHTRHHLTDALINMMVFARVG